MNKIFLIIIAILTLFFCLWPDFHPENELGLSYSWPLDMLFHGGYYFALTLVLLFFKAVQTKPLYSFLVLFSISFVLEILQNIIPNRTPTMLDLLSNALGIFLGVLIFHFTKLSLSKKRSKFL